MTVRIPIQADGGQVAKAFTDIRKAMERAGQAGRELSKIDLSHPELKEQAEDIRKVIGHYEELKRVWRQLDARTKATGQSGAAPWDLDLGRMYPTSGQAARARETLGQRLLSGTSWGARLPPGGGGGGGGGGGIPSVPGLGIPGGIGGLGGLLKFTAGMAGLGTFASMAKKGVEQAQQEAIALDPLWRRLQSTARSFDELREKTRALGSGLGVTYEKSVQLGSEFARLSGDANTAAMARGTRTAVGLARGLGMDPEAMTSFMGRAKFKNLFAGGEEKQFAAMIAAGVREGGMQAAPEKVLQAVDQLTDSLVRRGVNAHDQAGDIFGVMAMLNKSGNPALRGEYGASIMGQIGQGMVSPGMGDAGQFFMYRALGVRSPFESQLARERGPFDRGDDGVMAIEKVLRQFRRDIPNDEAQRAVGISNVLGIPALVAQKIDQMFADAEAMGVQMTAEDYRKADPSLGENEGSKTRETLTGIHDALTKTTSPLLSILNGIRGAVVFAAGPDYEESLLLRDKVPEKEFQAAVDAKTLQASVWNSVKSKQFRSNLAKQQFQAAIRKWAPITGVPEAIANLTVQSESGYDPIAGLGTEHVGGWQQSEAMAKQYHVLDRTDIEQSTRGSMQNLADLYKEFGSWDKAVGAYVAGAGNMRKAMRGEPNQIGPITAKRMADAARVTLDINVNERGKTTKHSFDIDTPQSSGTAAVAVP